MAEAKPQPYALRLHGLVPESVVDGPGLRCAVFVQGCPHHCPGCHNKSSHDPQGGYAGDVRDVLTLFKENPLLTGITLSGGEPLCQPAPLAWLAEQVKALGATVMLYTGHTLAEATELAHGNNDVRELLDFCDIVVDGPYVQALYDGELSFRGSSNQKIWKKKDEAWEEDDSYA